MNEPIGRCGSCRPARARRTAVDTACTASAWPMTRLASSSSMRSSFSFSPSSMRSTGTPVQRETTCATWSAVTASSTIAPLPSLRLDRLELLLELGDAAIGEFAGALVFAAALRIGELGARLLELGLELLRIGKLALLRLPARGQIGRLLLQRGQVPSRDSSAAPSSPGRSPSSAPPARSSAARSRGRSSRAPRAWSRPASSAAPPPRRPGRSPCRAGSGR